MTVFLPRDSDGFIDLDAFSDDEVDLSLSDIAPAPALPDDTWDAIVAAAPHTDPVTLDIVIEELAQGLAPAPTASIEDVWGDDLGEADGDIPDSDSALPWTADESSAVGPSADDDQHAEGGDSPWW